MPEKSARYRGMSPQEFAERSQQVLDATLPLPLDEVERRARAMTALARAIRAVGEVEPAGGVFDIDDDQLDAAGEQRLRDELLHRIIALNADLEAEERAGAFESGRDTTAAD